MRLNADGLAKPKHAVRANSSKACIAASWVGPAMMHGFQNPNTSGYAIDNESADLIDQLVMELLVEFSKVLYKYGARELPAHFFEYRNALSRVLIAAND